MQKCEISEEYNAKRGSEPSKTFDFRIDFSLNFDVFPNSLPDTIFRGSKCPAMLTNTIFDRFSIFQRSQNRSLERHFQPKKRFGSNPFSRPEHLGADLGAKWCRKRFKDILSSIWGRFLLDLEGILIFFGAFLILFFKKLTPF